MTTAGFINSIYQERKSFSLSSKIVNRLHMHMSRSPAGV